MTGQSVVQTGSRNVSSTTFPRRLASETCRPSWLVSVKFGAGVSSCPLVPAIASAVIGSAVLFTVANAIGAAPTMITPSAAMPAITRSGAPANASVGPASHPGRRAARGRIRSLCDGDRRCVRGRPLGQPQGADGEQQDQRDHVVGVGAETAEEAEVLHQHPVGQAEHGRADDGDPGQPRVRARRAHAERRPRRRQRDHRDQVDREPVGLGEAAEAGDDHLEHVRLRGSRHRLDHRRQRARLAVQPCPARSRARARPGAAPCRGRRPRCRRG